MNRFGISVVVIFSMIALSCGKNESKSPTPEENVRNSAAGYSATGSDKLYTCQPIDEYRRSEYIWIFLNKETGLASIDIAEIKAHGSSGIHHRGIVLLSKLEMIVGEQSVSIQLTDDSIGSYSSEYAGVDSELLRLNPKNFTAEIVKVVGYAENLEIKCVKH